MADLLHSRLPLSISDSALCEMPRSLANAFTLVAVCVEQLSHDLRRRNARRVQLKMLFTFVRLNDSHENLFVVQRVFPRIPRETSERLLGLLMFARRCESAGADRD